jgi:hypothetical protein
MKLHRCVAFALCAASFAGCKPPAPPKTDVLKNQFTVDLPSHWRTSSFVMDAEQPPATRSDPYRARFRAEVELLTPIYVEDQRFGDTVIVRMTGKAGERRSVFGRVESRLKNGRWASTLRLENNLADQAGRPRDFIAGRRVIVAGSAEEQAFWSARRRAEEEAATSAMQFQQEMERGMFVDALTGEWQGEVFSRRDSRLYITGDAQTLSATLLHEGTRESMTVRILGGRRVQLTGYVAVRQNGRPADNYYLDTFELELSADETLLHGAATDEGGQSGPVRLRKIGT